MKKVSADFYTQRELGLKIKEFLYEARLRPNTGKLYRDVINLLVVFVIQTSIFPTFLGTSIVIDLITPWLVMSFVRQKLFPATVLALVGAISLEMHSSFPAGLYVCIYWITANIIFQIKPALSWRLLVPWVVVFSVSALWVLFWESFIMVFTKGTDGINEFFVFKQFLRFAVAVSFGVVLCRPWLEFKEEEIINL
ncbi:MAG: hypothetical protein AB7T49_12730 [Oligoflexales bacterium]